MVYVIYGATQKLLIVPNWDYIEIDEDGNITANMADGGHQILKEFDDVDDAIDKIQDMFRAFKRGILFYNVDQD